ncbi:hypothetical protein G9A89_009214 [Geosiphon pyriformis]|nr:hypothetical protein G9A89_009214 [Geosiphon pyriformis]
MTLQKNETKRSSFNLELKPAYPPKKLWKPDMTTYKTLHLLAHVANFPYCFNKNLKKINVPRDDIKAGQFFDKETSELFVYFKGKILTKSQWMKRKTTLVNFKVENVAENALLKVDEEWFQDFQEIWPKIYDGILGIIFGEGEKNGLKAIYFVGHAIGGAYATLAALSWRLKRAIENDLKTKELDYPTQLVTFGAPRIGNVVFARFLNTWRSNSDFRMTSGNDHVPHFPATINGRNILAHAEIEIWIDSESNNCECPEKQPEFFKCPGIFPRVNNNNKKFRKYGQDFLYPPDEVKFGENQVIYNFQDLQY